MLSNPIGQQVNLCALEMRVELSAVEAFSRVERVREDLRITLKRRLATAAAAIVQRMISRRRPLVFRPVSPFKKGSKTSAAMSEVAVECFDNIK